MAFDPSTIGAIADSQYNAPESIGKATTLRDMADTEQLKKLQLNSAKSDAEESTKVKAILSQHDYTTPQGLAKTAQDLNRVSPKASMDLMKWGQQYQSGEIQQKMDALTLDQQKTDFMVKTLDPILSEARQLKASGASDLDVNALIASRVPTALQRLRAPGPDGKPILADEALKQITAQPQTLATLEGFEGQASDHAKKLQMALEQFKAQTQAKGEQTKERAELERERHDRMSEEQGNRRLDIAQTAAAAKASGYTDAESDLLAAMADKNVNLPAGLHSKEQIKATLAGELRKHPDMSPDEIAEGIRSGKLKMSAETRAAQTAGTQIGRVSVAVNEIEPFGRQVLEASNDLPRGTNLTLNGLMQMSQNQLNDPRLLKLKVKLQALNNAYDQLAARGGTDAAKREHVHSLFDTRLTQENIAQLVKAVNEEGAGAKEAADRTIGEVSNERIPGTQPTPPKTLDKATSRDLTPGTKFQHSSGATVEILSE